MKARLLAALLLCPAFAAAEPLFPYTLHYQGTVIDQGKYRFHSPYSGPNSQLPEPQRALSVTATLFGGVRLRPGTELYADPELGGGRGLGGTLGVAGFPNGEVYRVGDTAPVLYMARLLVKQTVGFGSGTESVEDGPNQVAGTLPARRLTFVGGRFALSDYFDNSAYAHDPRSQFFNWALMAQSAWDYPADTRGYTWGAMTEYHAPDWAVRGAFVLEPKSANQLPLDHRVGRANGSALEAEHTLSLLPGRKGAVRLLAFLNQAPMGDYAQAVAQAGPARPDVAATRLYGRTKYGVSLNADHELTGTLGAFARAGWSDGRHETWAFSETDASQSAGLEWKPARWGRPDDRWGAAVAADELNAPHRRYLAAGGLGFMLGDGALHYGPELIFETYYRWKVTNGLSASPDYQLVANPGYNRARGPLQVWGARVHAEF